jgi:hypothetical protein
MDSPHDGTAHPDEARAFLEQLLRTGIMLTDLFESLVEDLPEDAFPGEESGEVLMQMLTGTIQPVLAAAGARTLAEATSLIGAVGDRTLADLRAAMELARDAER